MARTRNPDDEVVKFVASIKNALSNYTLIDQLIRETQNGRQLEKALATDLAFRLCVEWEWFLHNWFVAAINKSQKKFILMKNDEMRRELDKIAGFQVVNEFYNLEVPNLPPTLSASQLERLADPEGRNLSFTNLKYLSKRAHSDLLAIYSDRVQKLSRSESDVSVVQFVRALRNYLAHRSSSSLTKLKDASTPVRTQTNGLVGKANQPLLRGSKKIRDIGVYLTARNGKLNQRVEILGNRLIVLAERLL